MCEEGLHDPFEDQVECARYKAERDALAQRVEEVCERMEAHCLGVEGMDDSPVASWARDLRAALGSLHAPGFQKSRKVVSSLTPHSDASDVTMSAHDLLPESEREAIAWVREHGGIEAVKKTWNRRSKLERQLEMAQAKVERQQRHIETVQGKCRERQEHICELNKLKRAYIDALNGVCKRLGLTDGTGLPDMPEVIWAELDRRLMPEGMEWPRYESGEPVRPGDRLLDKNGDWFEAVMFGFTCDWWVIRGYQAEGFGDLSRETRRKLDGMAHGKRVKRPAPKVYDADGAEVEIGDDLYTVEGMLKFHVSAIDKKSGRIATEAMFALDKWADPKMYTHRAPVIAADGRPLREGEHVYHIETGAELVVKELPKPGEYQAVVVFAPPASHLTSFDPDRLTHQRPVLDADGVPIKVGDMVWYRTGAARGVVESIDANSILPLVVYRGDNGELYRDAAKDVTHTEPEIDTWERIEEDAGCTATKYNERRGTIFTTKQQVARDLVRRCRALAERERGE